MKYSPGYEAMFYDIKEIEDTISVNNLINSYPETYRFYSINNKLSNSLDIKEYMYYLDILEGKNDLYTLDYFYDEICNNNLDIIKIQEPLDSWMKIYKANILLNKANVVIPVIYESLMEKPKYLLYKIELYEGSIRVKSMKVVELD